MASFDLIIEPDLKTVNTPDGVDLFVGDADQYNIQYTLHGEKGQQYAYPLLGVGFDKYINAKFYDGRVISREVQAEMEKDGYQVTELAINQDITTRDVTVDISADKIKDVL